jgi:hypothetical protein
LNCSKKEDNQIEYYTLNQEYKDWFFFKPGSYWIYHRDSTTQYDSLIVDSAYVITKYYPRASNGAKPFYFDYMKVSYIHNIFDISFDAVGGHGGVLSRNYTDTDTSWYPLFDIERNSIGLVDGFFDSHYGHNVGTREVLNYYNSIQIGNYLFQNVMVVQIIDYRKNNTTNFYLAKGLGTVEFQIIQNNDTVSWLLNKWQIIN